MLLQEDKVLRDKRKHLLFIGILSLILIFASYLEITNGGERTLSRDIFFQDTALDDPSDSYYFVRSQKSKDVLQGVSFSLTTHIKASLECLPSYCTHFLLNWYKPTYYEFLFRYTLF